MAWLNSDLNTFPAYEKISLKPNSTNKSFTPYSSISSCQSIGYKALTVLLAQTMDHIEKY